MQLQMYLLATGKTQVDEDVKMKGACPMQIHPLHGTTAATVPFPTKPTTVTLLPLALLQAQLLSPAKAAAALVPTKPAVTGTTATTVDPCPHQTGSHWHYCNHSRACYYVCDYKINYSRNV
jgi:hypothetical protein